MYECMYTHVRTEICMCKIHKYAIAPRWGLSTRTKEFTAAARIMKSSSNIVNSLISDKV